MRSRTWLLPVLLLSALPAVCEIHDLLKSAEIDALLAKTDKSTDILIKPNYIISLRVQSGPGSFVTHSDSDEIWVVRRGTAKLSLGSVSLGSGGPQAESNFDVGAGDVVHVPRTMAYRLVPGAPFQYVAVRVFTAPRAQSGRGSSSQPEPGRGSTNRAITYVAPNAGIQETFLKNTTNTPFGGINCVIYNAAPGPYEVHSEIDDVYFVRLGNAVAKVDGHLINPTSAGQGEIRGTGAFGFREYKISAGDILLIPRNTMHYMDPGGEKLGYMLFKIRSE